MKILLPSILAKFADNESELVCSAPTIDGMISAISLRYPLLAERIAKEGKLNRFLNVYVNDEDIRFLDGQNTKVGENDVVSFVPMIAGG
jgi:sulfur-carrier protein